MKNTFLLIIGLFGFGFCAVAQPYNVVWVEDVNVAVTGNSLQKTNATYSWDAGAFSENVLASGTDGWIEMTINELGKIRAFGFSDQNTNTHFNTIDYGLYLQASNVVAVYENGSLKGNYGAFAQGDIFRIERTGFDVSYAKNGQVFYTSTTFSSSDLYADASLLYPNSTVFNVRASFDVAGGSGGGNNGGGSGDVWSTTGDDIYYNTGNVGIGNDAPTSLLHITASAGGTKGLTIESGGNTNFQVMGDGRVFAREVEVTLSNFPDYVFAKDYTLMPLGELKKYIEANHHLPNIPSAKEVEENGMGMGELNLKQVEKIEELTLYILQLDERLQKLEAENAALKQQLKKD